MEINPWTIGWTRLEIIYRILMEISLSLEKRLVLRWSRWLKEMNDCDPNEEVLSVCEVDGKPIVFVLHESD